MAVSFIGGGNRSTRRKPPTCRKWLTNFTSKVNMTQRVKYSWYIIAFTNKIKIFQWSYKLRCIKFEHSMEINVREYRRGNPKRTIQRNWQHRVHKTKINKTKTQHNMCWTPLYANKHKYTIRHDPSYKQLEVKTNQTSFLCGSRNGHHNAELRTLRHILRKKLDTTICKHTHITQWDMTYKQLEVLKDEPNIVFM